MSVDQHGAFKEELRKIFTRYAGIPLESTAIDIPIPYAWGVVEKVDGFP